MAEWYSDNGTGGAAARPGPSSVYQLPYCCIVVRCCTVLIIDLDKKKLDQQLPDYFRAL